MHHGYGEGPNITFLYRVHNILCKAGDEVEALVRQRIQGPLCPTDHVLGPNGAAWAQVVPVVGADRILKQGDAIEIAAFAFGRPWHFLSPCRCLGFCQRSLEFRHCVRTLSTCSFELSHQGVDLGLCVLAHSAFSCTSSEGESENGQKAQGE